MTTNDTDPWCSHCMEGHRRYATGLCNYCQRHNRLYGELPSDEVLSKRFNWDELYKLILQDKERHQ